MAMPVVPRILRNNEYAELQLEVYWASKQQEQMQLDALPDEDLEALEAAMSERPDPLVEDLDVEPYGD